MIYLSDNDIVQKLAICDLLGETLEAFDAEPSDVFVLPTLKYRVGIGSPLPRTVKRLGEAAAARLAAFLSSVREIEGHSVTDHELLESLDESVEIDAGEIVLLSATALVSDYFLLTGDKRCIRAVASHPVCAAIADRIRGRVVCFEQIVLRVIDRNGFEAVRTKVAPALHCDTALRAAFGSGDRATRESACVCLESYIAELRGLRIDLLMPGC